MLRILVCCLCSVEQLAHLGCLPLLLGSPIRQTASLCLYAMAISLATPTADSRKTSKSGFLLLHFSSRA